MQQSGVLLPILSSALRYQAPGSSRLLARSQPFISTQYRRYATQGQQEPPFSGSSDAASEYRTRLEKEAQAAPGATNAKFGPERLGPFPMGGGRVRAKKWAPWKDLDIGGKSESSGIICGVVIQLTSIPISRTDNGSDR